MNLGKLIIDIDGPELTEEDKDNKQCPEMIKGKLNETTN